MGKPTLLPARTFNWTKEHLPSISRYFEYRPAEQLLGDALDNFGDEIALATGFGTSGVVLMHMVAQLRPQTTVFYLQTDLLFPETMALRDRLSERLGIQFTEVHSGLSLEAQVEQHGPDLWAHNPDLCCHLRKVVPLRRYLIDKKAWITGLRRDQSAARANTPLVAWDAANGLVKLNPLAGWTGKDIWRYLYINDLPYNELHDQGYPSVGCQPCTRPVARGEDERAGRWAGWEKTECGIHLQPLQAEAA
jgi:phosphoadenosine phosphosulfate reductase